MQMSEGEREREDSGIKLEDENKFRTVLKTKEI